MEVREEKGKQMAEERILKTRSGGMRRREERRRADGESGVCGREAPPGAENLIL